MENAWETPEILRLSRIEEWRKARFERALRGGDFATAKRAADLYTVVAARATDVALDSVSTYRD
jgi:hypothetical protein